MHLLAMHTVTFILKRTALLLFSKEYRLICCQVDDKALTFNAIYSNDISLSSSFKLICSMYSCQ